MVRTEPQYPIGTLVMWDGNIKYEKASPTPFVVQSHWYDGYHGWAAYPGLNKDGYGYWEKDLVLAEGPW